MALNYYGSVEAATDYFTARGIPSWDTASLSDQTAALIRGSAYIDARYGQKFSGERADGYEQVLSWPRVAATTSSGFAIPPESTPTPITLAAYEAAILELGTPGYFNSVVVGSQIVTRERVGDLEVSYANNSSNLLEASTPVVSLIDSYLTPFLWDSRGFGIAVV